MAASTRGRIKEIEDKLARRAEIIDPPKLAGRIRSLWRDRLSSLNTSTDEEVTYQLLGADEAEHRHRVIRSA